MEPKYNQGEKYTHSARRENKISNLLDSAMLNIGSGAIKGSYSNGISFQCYNHGKVELKKGSVVIFLNSKIYGDDIVPVELINKKNEQKVYGVIENNIAPNGIGIATISGISEVKVCGSNDDDTDLIVPNIEKPTEFKFSTKGTSRVIRNLAGNNYYAIINCASNQGTEDEEDTPLAFDVSIDQSDPENVTITVKSGFYNVNGVVFGTTRETKLKIQTGYLSLYTDIINRNIITPSYVWASPSLKNFPIAYVTQDKDGIYHVKSSNVAVATFMISKNCPMAKFKE